MKKVILLIIVSTILASLAIAVWYAPILFKGYNSTILDVSYLQRANNLAKTNLYSSESENNIVLSTEILSEQGVKSSAGSKLSSHLFSYIIEIFGQPTNEQVVFINSIILALALVIFSLAVYLLFGIKIYFIFSLLYIFFPPNWFIPQTLVGYQFSILFLSLFFLLLVLGSKGLSKDIKINYKSASLLFLSGIFVSLSALSKEALMIFLPVLFLYLFIFFFPF